jgi:acyl transferase domain-containing protein/NADPH:quinone reductase-like Zn-dependent oxidoreductase/short-subunit dehydrogenase/acyl carrier protein
MDDGKLIHGIRRLFEAHSQPTPLAANAPIAIVGAACRLPGAPDLEAFWQLLCAGTDAVGTLPADRFSQAAFFHPRKSEPGRAYSFAAGHLGDISQFDAPAFGLSPREAVEMDPQQRLLLEVTAEAIEDAGWQARQLAGRPVGAFIGGSSTDYAELRLTDSAGADRYFMTGNALSILSNRLTNAFDLRGAGQTIDTACSSSLVALHLAVQAMRAGQIEAALVGGVQLLLSPYAFTGFSRAGMLSRRGRCQAFDAGADGYVRGEGAGMIVLKPLAAALADGDRVRGVILGTGTNAAGRTIGLSLPNREAQAALLARVMRESRVARNDIAYFEAHGTGTQAGDPVETWAIGHAVAHGRAARLPIGSVKTNIGHLEPASGMAGLLKAMLVLERGALPPSLHFNTPNPNIDFAGLNLRVTTRLEPLPLHPGAVVGVNSFGFGGTNATVMLGAAPEPVPAPPQPGTAMPPLLISAHSEPALKALAARWRDTLAAKVGAVGDSTTATASTSATATNTIDEATAGLLRGAARFRDLHPHRLALRGDDAAGLALLLDGWLAGETSAAVTRGTARATADGLVAFVFSGNGAQFGGMAREAMATNAVFRAAVEEADAVMAPLTGWSGAQKLAEGVSAEELAGTDHAQPLLFLVQVGIVAVLVSKGLHPGLCLGHSVGEVAAAHAAGILTLAQAARLVVARSRAQHMTRGRGRMAALGANAETAAPLIAQAGTDESGWGAEIAAFNAPDAITVAGPVAVMTKLVELAKRHRIPAVLLALDYAFHSSAMDPVRQVLAREISGLEPAEGRLPFLSSVTGSLLPGQLLDAEYWWRNLRAPVRFQAAVQAAVDAGARLFIEIGPNSLLQSYLRDSLVAAEAEAPVLGTLSRRDPPGDPFPAIADRAFVHGADPRQGAVWSGLALRDGLPATPFHRQRHWLTSTPESLHVLDAPRDHPLLGFRQGGDATRWSRVLDSELDPWLADHALGGEPVLPAAGMADMALAAAALHWPDAPALELRDLQLLRTLPVPAATARELRFTLDPESGLFQIESRPRLSGEAWTMHARGQAGPATLAALPDTALADLAGCDGPDGRRVSGEQVLATARRFGLDYGPAFRPLVDLRIAPGGDSAVARLALPASAPADDAGWLLHPVRLDGAMQGLLELMAHGQEDDGRAMVPVRLGRLVLRRGGALPVRAELIVTHRGERSGRCALLLRDGSGQVVARLDDAWMQGVRLRQRQDLADAVFRVVQQPALCGILAARQSGDAQAAETHAGDTSPGATSAGSTQAGGTQAFGMRAFNTPAGASPAGAMPEEEASSLPAAIDAALAHDAGLDLTEASLLLEAHVIASAHAVLLSRAGPDALVPAVGLSPYARALLHTLVEDGLAEAAPLGWRLLQPADALPAATEIWRAVLDESPTLAHELAWLALAAERLPAVLDGQGQPEAPPPPEAAGFTRLAGVMAEAAGRIAAAWPLERPLRVLEVGSQGGPLTRALLAALERSGRTVRYVATAPAGDARAAAIPTHGERVTFSFEPWEGAALPGPADLVVGLATAARARLGTALLGSMARALSPGGTLLLAEPLPGRAWTFANGQDAGWWEGHGPGGAALPARDTWQDALDAGPWAEARIEPLAAAPWPALLLAARRAPETLLAAPEPPAAPAIAGLRIYADAASTPLARALGAAAPGLVVVPLAQVGRIAPRAVAGIRVVAMLSPDTAGLAHCLAQVTALAEVSRGSAAGFVLLVRGDATSPEAAACLGLGRVLANEMPELKLRRIAFDAGLAQIGLAPNEPVEPGAAQASQPQDGAMRTGRTQAGVTQTSPTQTDLMQAGPAPVGVQQAPVAESQPEDATLAPGFAARLLAELLGTAPEPEPEVRLTAAARLVPRLVPGFAPATPPAGPARLAIRQPGQLGSLAWEPMAPLPADGADVVVRVAAAGLNFRDLMWAQGLLPEEALMDGFAGPTLGMEMAGVVESAPAGSGFAAGDKVFGFAPAAMASRARTRPQAIARLPEGLGFAAAATLPVAFLTAVYALETCANIRPGETVLIHGGAGAVGLAALQVARAAGARVAATAGSPAKRAFLRAAGAELVLDSRDPGFADQLRATWPDGVDVVLNSLAGDAMERSLELTKPFGRFVELGKRDFFENRRVGLRPWRRNLTYFGVDVDQLPESRPDLAKSLLEEIARRLAAGELHPLPYAVRGPDEVEAAFRTLQASAQIGKLVLIPPEVASPAIPAGRVFAHGTAASRVAATNTSTAGTLPAGTSTRAQKQSGAGGGEARIDTAARDPARRADRRGATADGAAGGIAEWMPPQGTILVVGGIQGFGFECAKWLAAHGATDLALLSRRGGTARGAEAAVRALAALGARATVHAADAADARALAGALADIRAEGPKLVGVVHAAAVLDDGAAASMTAARFERVLAPKLGAALNLDRLTRADPIALFLLFSSATTAMGNPGQANYVAANAALEALALRRQGEGLPALAIGWGPIADTGLLSENAGAAEILARRLGVEAMTAAESLDALPQMLAAQSLANAAWMQADATWQGGLPVLSLARIGWRQARLALPILEEPLFDAVRGQRETSAGTGDLRAHLLTLAPEEARALLRQVVREEAARILRLPPDAIPTDAPVAGMGLDSLGGLELRGALEQRLGMSVPLASVTEDLTVDVLARRLADGLRDGRADDAVADIVEQFEPSQGEAQAGTTTESPAE